MRASRSLLFVSLALALAGVLIATGIYYWWGGRHALDQSLASVLESRLSMSYEIRRARLSVETDMNGDWWLRSNGVALINRLQSSDSGFSMADEADLAESRRAIEEALKPEISLQNHELFKAEFSLGQGTICETLPCNVEILASPKGDDVFVRISKT